MMITNDGTYDDGLGWVTYPSRPPYEEQGQSK